MNEQIVTAIDSIVEAIQNTGPLLSIVLAFSLVLLESIVAVLPLAIIIGINVLTFGPVLGFIISWAGTIVGCMISFTFFDQYAKKRVMTKFVNNEKAVNLIHYIDKKSFQFLVILIAIPFTPAFLVNVAAGISDISPRKYFFALLISKISIIYFWGFIGATIYESITSPLILLQVGVVLAITYIISKIISKKLISQEEE